MVMIQPDGKSRKIARKVLKGKGVEKPKRNVVQKSKLTGPYLQH